jgi:hypothetical protein
VTGTRLGLVVLAGLGCAGLGCREQRQADSIRADSTVTAAPSDSLRLRIDVPPAVRTGQPVPIVVRGTNAVGRPLHLYLLGRTPTFDVTVTAEDGRLVWRRLQDSMVPAILQVRTLAPDEVLEARCEWDQRGNDGATVSPGRYLVRGMLLTDSPRPFESPAAALQVLPS